jgi:hypothetical protein
LTLVAFVARAQNEYCNVFHVLSGCVLLLLGLAAAAAAAATDHLFSMNRY